MNVLQEFLEKKKKELPGNCNELKDSFDKVINCIKNEKIRLPMKPLKREMALEMLLQDEKLKQNENAEIEFALIQEHLSSIKK